MLHGKFPYENLWENAHKISLPELSFESEVLELNEPVRQMDQYVLSVGNIIFLETNKKDTFTIFHKKIDDLILVDSGIPKDTLGLLSKTKKMAFYALEKIKKHKPDFDLSHSHVSDFKEHKHLISYKEQQYFYGALKNYEITKMHFRNFKMKHSI